MKVLLSIKPEFTDRILDGSKRFEFRKAIHRNTAVRTVVIYATKPVGLLVGEFDFDRIVSGRPESVWAETAHLSGITHAFFREYFEGRDRAYALEISRLRTYEPPIRPEDRIENFTPPQGFMYIDDDLKRLCGDDRQYDLIF